MPLFDHPLAEALAQAEHRRPPLEISAERKGAELLDVHVKGDVVILQDASGEFLAEFLDRNLNVSWFMDEVYTAFADVTEDDYEYVCFYLVRDFGLFFAFYQPVANDVYGIGYDQVVASETFDLSSDSKLEGLIFMNYYGMWLEEPEQGRYVFGQEFMHRWGSFVNIEHDSLDQNALLGRDLAHWSYWMDTTNSPMEGNDWVDNGDGTWTIDQASGSTYSDLDLYLMGLVGPEEVGPQTFLIVDEAEQERVGRAPETTPEYFGDLFEEATDTPITVSATPVSFTLDDIVAAEGERSPSAEDSPKSFRMAHVIIALEGDEITDELIADVDGLRTTFEADWEEDVGGRADLDMSLGASTAPEWGVPVDTGGDPDSAVVEETDDEEEEPGGCGCGGGAAPTLATLALGLGALRRRKRWSRAG